MTRDLENAVTGAVPDLCTDRRPSAPNADPWCEGLLPTFICKPFWQLIYAFEGLKVCSHKDGAPCYGLKRRF
jgi:hypothetical protein